jgi:hypothetical protein
VAISGRYVVVHVAGNDQGSTPWPEEMRVALASPVAFSVDLVVRPAP